ncbi:MAG: hypothetical protein LBJ64_06290 [Deltaproteobacteria bacterium]|nr:hypothetical protein [Deltaproteobacteria bacterium]
MTVHGHNPAVQLDDLHDPECGLQSVFRQFRSCPKWANPPFLHGRYSS